MALTFISWMWGTKYAGDDVAKLVDGLRRNTTRDFRFLLLTDRERDDLPPAVEQERIRDPELANRSCFCRLRMFDPDWQTEHGLTGQFVCLDLDNVIVGNIDELFHTSENFMILRGANAVNPNPFNCSVMMLRAGKYADVWRDFTPEKAASIRFYEFPDDQGWIWHKIPGIVGWSVGERSGIYGFQKPGWGVPASQLPRNARIVSFIGWRKPHLFQHLGWVNKHWRVGR